MIPLPIDYKGFKLGMRVGDRLALFLDITNPAHIHILHQLKNMVYVMQNMSAFNAFGINGITYAPK